MKPSSRPTPRGSTTSAICLACGYRGPMAISDGRRHWSGSGCAFMLLALLGGVFGFVLMGVLGMLALSILIGIVGALVVRPSSAYHSCPRCHVDLQWR
ncbi:hypothetical protein [Stenotrophomonas lactitubi]|uniref:hypothetical protein n=1 Tax=Stenotrophomonas lactitubi TaxID=2045214 RepID=UPI00320AFB8D